MSAHKMENSSSGKIRTNLLFRREVIKFYVPKKDQLVPIAFHRGCRSIEAANGSEGSLISGYFTVVCTVLPDLVPLAERIMNVLGFQVDIVSELPPIAMPYPVNLRLQAVKFAQLCFLPLLISDAAEVGTFWTRIATKLAVEPSLLFGSTEMITIYRLLSTSALLPMLKEQIFDLWQNLTITSPFDSVFCKAVEENRRTMVYSLIRPWKTG